MVDLTNIIGVEGMRARPKQKRKTMRELYAEMAEAGLVITTVITDGVIKRVPTKDRPNKTKARPRIVLDHPDLAAPRPQIPGIKIVKRSPS